MIPTTATTATDTSANASDGCAINGGRVGSVEALGAEPALRALRSAVSHRPTAQNPQNTPVMIVKPG